MEHPWKKEGPSAPAAINRAYKPGFIISARIDVALATIIDARAVAGWSIVVPTGYTSTTFTFYAHVNPDETFLPLYKSTNAAVTMTVAAGRVYALPDEVYNVPYFKIISNANEDFYIFGKG